MQKILLSFLIAGLAGCATHATKRDTYDLINAEMRKAVETNALPAQQDAVFASLLPPLTIEMPKTRQSLEERFNLSFSNAPATQFFMGIVSGTRYNMLVHPDVTGTISAKLNNVTLFETLDAIREIYGYEYKVEGTRIYVKPPGLQTSIFQVNYLNSKREGTSGIRVTSSAANNSDSGGASSPTSEAYSEGSVSSKIITTSENDFWTELRASLGIIVGNKDGRSVVISPQSGVVVIRAMSDELRNVSTFLKATQLSVDRQVILEAKIMEVELNDSFQSGINWGSFEKNRSSVGFLSPGSTVAPIGGVANRLSSGGKLITGTSNSITETGNLVTETSNWITPGSALGAASTAAGSLFGLAFQTSNFAALISFLESQGTVHVLSSPRIATMNNQKAVLKVGTDEYFVTKFSKTPTTISLTGEETGGEQTVEAQPFFSGVALDVTPQIDASGNITLHVHPSVSTVTQANKSIDLGAKNGSLTLPYASTAISETDSVVRGQDGRIIAIGGLMRQESFSDRSQVPGAGNIPVVGNLFRNTNRVSRKRELVILIKPTVIQGDDSWAQDMIDSQRRIQGLAPRDVPGMY